MNLEDVMLSKISLIQRTNIVDSTYMRYLIKIIVTESKMVVASGWG